MYNNVGPQPGVPRPPTNPQPNPFGNAFYGAGSGLIRGGLGAYGEKILGSSSEYVQSNIGCITYMESTAEAEFAAFLKKIERTVYVDNLSPHVTEPVLRTALNQFGTVMDVKFIPNYLEPKYSTCCALVEMKEVKQAVAVIQEIEQFPFMVSGMPRPVRARAAEVEMFDDRPVKPGRKIQCRWLDPSHPHFEVAEKLKRLTWKHAAEASFLLKRQVEREEKLHKQQLETLKSNYRKYEMIESIMSDRSAQKLARSYNMRVGDDW
ncbi:uncharacterized protein LOC8266419 [Ricinus communis]|uniref:RRM domain-containing protein n=1 Tax=Ricinus communis TaxID=3988 RepID=B9T7B8_RICCO|nr:uncharacterized protein LOC8266419 [Ricinus communis]EEF28241.1 conserved hypothetical protein [Ricinus communis]|eukprot:XP_002534137.1 uncharacterized protein LOC8266419 [Ricinus communis]